MSDDPITITPGMADSIIEAGGIFNVRCGPESIALQSRHSDFVIDIAVGDDGKLIYTIAQRQF